MQTISLFTSQFFSIISQIASNRVTSWRTIHSRKILLAISSRNLTSSDLITMQAKINHKKYEKSYIALATYSTGNFKANRAWLQAKRNILSPKAGNWSRCRARNWGKCLLKQFDPYKAHQYKNKTIINNCNFVRN